MSLATDRRPTTPLADTGRSRPAPLVWQRTDTVGTEVVFGSGDDPRGVDGSVVVAGPVPHSTSFHADLDADWAVRALTVTCSGGGWARTLRLARTAAGAWACETEQTGDLGGHATPPPGTDDLGRLQGATIVRLDPSPIFVTWALRHLDLAPGAEPRPAPTVRILTPSLAIRCGTPTYQRVSRHRLRIAGDGSTAHFDLDPDGLVTYQPARLRLAR